MLTFNRKYFTAALALFLIEVFIALYVRDQIVRPYIGDYLVVILIYCSVRAMFVVSPIKLAIGVLLFAFMVEWLQYMHLIRHLGLQHNTIAKVILGTGFEWIDMLMYTLGIATVLIWEKKVGRGKTA